MCKQATSYRGQQAFTYSPICRHGMKDKVAVINVILAALELLTSLLPWPLGTYDQPVGLAKARRILLSLCWDGCVDMAVLLLGAVDMP